MKATYLLLQSGKEPQLINGIKVANIEGKPGVRLGFIPNIMAKKSRAFLDRDNPADIVKDGRFGDKIFDVFFKPINGQFSQPSAFVTLAKPNAEDEGTVAVLTSKRWPELGYKIVSGKPNGSIAPGLQVLKNGDTIDFTWESKTYTLGVMADEITLTGGSKNQSQRTKGVEAENIAHKATISELVSK